MCRKIFTRISFKGYGCPGWILDRVSRMGELLVTYIIIYNPEVVDYVLYIVRFVSIIIWFICWLFQMFQMVIEMHCVGRKHSKIKSHINLPSEVTSPKYIICFVFHCLQFVEIKYAYIWVLALGRLTEVNKKAPLWKPCILIFMHSYWPHLYCLSLSIADVYK